MGFTCTLASNNSVSYEVEAERVKAITEEYVDILVNDAQEIIDLINEAYVS